jgi:hypothetical protein
VSRKAIHDSLQQYGLSPFSFSSSSRPSATLSHGDRQICGRNVTFSDLYPPCVAKARLLLLCSPTNEAIRRRNASHKSLMLVAARKQQCAFVAASHHPRQPNSVSFRLPVAGCGELFVDRFVVVGICTDAALSRIGSKAKTVVASSCCVVVLRRRIGRNGRCL